MLLKQRKSGIAQALIMLTEPADESNKRRGVLSSNMKRRRRVQMVEHPGQISVVRNQVARSTSTTQSRPLSADDILKAKMRSQFMQSKHEKTVILPDEKTRESLIRSTSSLRSFPPSVCKSHTQNELEEQRNLDNAVCKSAIQPHDVKEPPWKKFKRIQVPWWTPPEVKISEEWCIGDGANSKEVEVQSNRIRCETEIIYRSTQEIPSDPKEPCDREMNPDDTLTSEIPIEKFLDVKPIEPSSVFLDNNIKEVIAPVASTSSKIIHEPDLELLAELLKNPLTPGQARNLLSGTTVQHLNMIKANVMTLLGMLDENAEDMVEGSLQSPTPSSELVPTKHGKTVTLPEEKVTSESLKRRSSSHGSFPPPVYKSRIHTELEKEMKLDSAVSKSAKQPHETSLDVEEPPRKKSERIQVIWRTPLAMKISEEWRISDGANSKEVKVQSNRIRREREIFYRSAQEIPSDPKEPWDRETDPDDTLTPEIPIEQFPDVGPLKPPSVSHDNNNKETRLNMKGEFCATSYSSPTNFRPTRNKTNIMQSKHGNTVIPPDSHGSFPTSISESHTHTEFEDRKVDNADFELTIQPHETSLDVKETFWKKLKGIRVPWRIPREVKISEEWCVADGANSKEFEVQSKRIRREREIIYIQQIPSDPKEPWDREMDPDDTLTPEIPIQKLPGVERLEPPSVSHDNNKEIVEPVASTSKIIPEPDHELLKNPQLVFPLTSGQACNLSSDTTVKLLDMINGNGSGVFSGNAENKVDVSLQFSTPSSEPVPSGPRPDFSRNPFSGQLTSANGNIFQAPRPIQPQVMVGPLRTLTRPQFQYLTTSATQSSTAAPVVVPPLVASLQARTQSQEHWYAPISAQINNQSRVSTLHKQNLTTEAMVNSNTGPNFDRRTSNTVGGYIFNPAYLPKHLVYDKPGFGSNYQYQSNQNVNRHNDYVEGAVQMMVPSGGRNNLAGTLGYGARNPDNSPSRFREYFSAPYYGEPNANSKHGYRD